MHAVACAPENLPDLHATHCRLSSYFPAAHATHWACEDAPGFRLYVPPGQAWQSCAAPAYGLSRNVCGGQSRQALAFTGAY